MKQILNMLEADGNLRVLKSVSAIQKYLYFENKQYLNFSSNDYLGLSDPELQREFFSFIDIHDEFIMSNPSSRLMTGNSNHYTELEKSIAKLYNRESSLVLSSGFMLNIGVLPALTTKDDLIVADKLVHASVIDGVRMCDCRWLRYKHNDMESLVSILDRESKSVKGNIYIVTESVFSMDGDIVPLKELVAIKKRYSAKLYLDEAHAFGVRGLRGCGISEECEVIDDVDYIVATMGKALASQGAFIVCDSLTKEMLVNKMRTLIFSTALPPISLMWSKFIIDKLPQFNDRRITLVRNVNILIDNLRKSGIIVDANSHIIPIIIGDSSKTLELSDKLKDNGIWVSAIRHPTVPKGSERLRLSLTALFSIEDIQKLAHSIIHNIK